MAWCKACCRCLGTAQPEVDVAAQPAVEAEAQPDADAAAQQHAAPDPSPTVASGHFTTTEALLATVEDGSVGPLSGRYLMGLAEGWMGFPVEMFISDPVFFWQVLSFAATPNVPVETLLDWATTSGGGLLQRRQDLPEEAFFVPSKKLLAKLPSYKKYFFLALSYRWLTASPLGGGNTPSKR